MPVKAIVAFLLILIAGTSPLFAEEIASPNQEGTIFTLWPLIDYRESPKEGYSNLSILGPLFKFQRRGEERDIVLRPFFYNSTNSRAETSKTSYLYPIASSEKSPDTESTQVLKLYQNNKYRKGEEGEQKDRMLFPFYISGKSGKYGPYTSVFPFYGDMYERFWRDEYHYIMFPLYSRTVKNGTTSRNYLYPLVSILEGDKERGFQFWPLYGQSAKDGVYRKRFAIWPVYMEEDTGLDTVNPTHAFNLFPFYTSVTSPNRTSHHYMWPFFGHTVDKGKKSEEWDYFWPFFVTVRGESRNMNRYIPFYSEDTRKESNKHWYMWPMYSHEELFSPSFKQERDRILYFLYSDNEETWSIDGKSRRRVALWPLFTYKRDEKGIRTVTFPAPIEPILDREGIEKVWAPLWRIYVHKWNDADDSAVSVLWNLYWHESRKEGLAFELFPLLSYSSEKRVTDFKLFKGLFRYRKGDTDKKVSFFWLPFGIHCGKSVAGSAENGQVNSRSKQ